MNISPVLKTVNNYVNKSVVYVTKLAGAQKLAKIPKSFIPVLSALGIVSPGLNNFASLCGSVDEAGKVVGSATTLNDIRNRKTKADWASRCLVIGSIMEGALVLIKLNVLPTTDNLFSYMGRISLFKNLGERICSMSNGKAICEKLFALTSLEMIKNYVFLASAVFTCKALWANKPSNVGEQETQKNNWIKEACKVAGVLTGSALFLGFVNTDKKKVVAFGILTTTSLVGYHMGVQAEQIK